MPRQAGVVVDHQFSDRRLAALYDAFWPWDDRGDFGFYFPMVMAADAVLDAGCGTGMLLHAAREAGHRGRLVGLDPADGMLAQARTRTDIEWVKGDLTPVRWRDEFDLVVMTGHAFQVLVEDDEIQGALTAIRSALTEYGRFAFETRNPCAREWERWTPEHAAEVCVAGTVVRMAHQVDLPIARDTVSFTTTYQSPTWDRPELSRSTLRFLDAEALCSFLFEAGLAIEEQFGDWDRSPVTATSPELITIASPYTLAA